MDFINSSTFLLFAIPFAIITWLWFQAINKVILKLFRNKKSILTEALKWIIFIPSTYLVLLDKVIKYLLLHNIGGAFVFLYSFMRTDCMWSNFIILEQMYSRIDQDTLKTICSYIGIRSILFLAIARGISLLIKKLTLFIAKKIKKESKAEIVAEAISWGIFAFAFIVAAVLMVAVI